MPEIVRMSYIFYSDTDGDGIMEDSEIFHSYDPQNHTLLRVNLNTGEMDFIRCGTENRETP